MLPTFIHATTVCLGERGVLIRGAPGAGKSTLALAILAAWDNAGRHAALVADDQTGLQRAGDALIAVPHPHLANAMEQRGVGIIRPRAIPACRLSIAVDLVPQPTVQRLPEENHAVLLGVALPVLRCPARASDLACRALWQVLGSDGQRQHLPSAPKPPASPGPCRLDAAAPSATPSATGHAELQHAAFWRVSE